MLQQRIITALVLLAILLPALFYPSPEPFMLVALVLICLAAWEWGQLNGYSKKSSWWMALDCLALCAGAWHLQLPFKATPALWLILGGAWVLLGVWLLKRGVNGWSLVPKWLRIVLGVFLIAAAWLAVAQARVLGINFLLSTLVLVWAADIGAYFAGRAFGRRKLAISISPGKSWEGVWGGMLAVLLVALAWRWADSAIVLGAPSLFTHLGSLGRPLFIVALLFLCAMSVVGDLVESLVKRSAGAKDSSNLLPGHGGVLDRLDALLPAVPLAMMLAGLAR
jgi:phosphatidate cytidylyltransferase